MQNIFSFPSSASQWKAWLGCKRGRSLVNQYMCNQPKLSCFVVFVNWISFRAVISVFVLQHYCTRLAQTWTYVAAVVYAGHTCRPVAHGELRGYWPTPPVLIIVNIQKAKDCSASTFCLNDSRKLLLVENVLPVLGSAAHRSGSQVIVREPGAPSPRLMTGSVHPVAAQSPALPLYSAVMCFSQKMYF